MTSNEARQRTLEAMDRLVEHMPAEEYEETLHTLIEDLEIRREAVLMELEEERE